jgi:hypothetical protein
VPWLDSPGGKDGGGGDVREKDTNRVDDESRRARTGGRMIDAPEVGGRGAVTSSPPQMMEHDTDDSGPGTGATGRGGDERADDGGENLERERSEVSGSRDDNSVTLLS